MADTVTKEFVIKHAKISHRWMLRAIANEEINTNIANLSDELKHAKLVQEMLEMF